MEDQGMSFIEYQAHDIACEAYVARPAGAGPHPAVLIAPTVRGPTPLEHAKADALAGEGYMAIVLDHYGRAERDLGDRARELMNALLADRALLRTRLLAHLAFAQGVEGADRSRIAIVGYCFGGLCALDLARTGTDAIKGAVSIHGIFSRPELGPQPSIAAKVLVLHGWDDPLATPDSVLGLTKELTEAGADWQLHAYGHTVHGFTNPEAAVPGRVVYNEDADRRANVALSAFLAEALA
jgi:dienelactone hydrolase